MFHELVNRSVMVVFAGRGAFKFRGACNAVLSLPQEQAERGVITHSSGNHAGALALAAKARGIPCTVITPQGTPKCKLDAIRWCSQPLIASSVANHANSSCFDSAAGMLSRS